MIYQLAHRFSRSIPVPFFPHASFISWPLTYLLLLRFLHRSWTKHSPLHSYSYSWLPSQIFFPIRKSNWVMDGCFRLSHQIWSTQIPIFLTKFIFDSPARYFLKSVQFLNLNLNNGVDQIGNAPLCNWPCIWSVYAPHQDNPTLLLSRMGWSQSGIARADGATALPAWGSRSELATAFGSSSLEDCLGDKDRYFERRCFPDSVCRWANRCFASGVSHRQSCLACP